MDPISGDALGFQQTQTTRVSDPGPVQNANPPPPPPKSPGADPVLVSAPSPHPLRGQTLNTVA